MTHDYCETFSPMKYVAQVEDTEKKKKYMDGWKQACKMVEGLNIGDYEKLYQAFANADCNLMAKTKEAFCFIGHYVFMKNRPRLISSPGAIQAALVGAYNKTMLNVIRKYFDQHIPLGLNTTDMEKFFEEHFGLDPEDLLCDADGSAFDSHQSFELMNAVDDPFHQIGIEFYLLTEGENTARELGLDPGPAG